MSNSVASELVEEIRNTNWIPELFSKTAAAFPDRAVYSQPHNISRNSREWRARTYREIAPSIWKLAHYLKKCGVQPGDRVAILSATRPEWMIADLAILYVGATSVSIYQSVNALETGYILHDSGAKCLFVENQEQADKIADLLRNNCPIPATEERPAQEVRVQLETIISFEAVEAHIPCVALEKILADTSLSAAEPSLVASNEIASLVYTSGTTGPPKGVVQTHKNHLANLWQAASTNLFAPDGDIFLFLPLAHSFARLIGYIGFLTPTLIKFPAVSDPKSSALNVGSVMRDLQEGSAQVVPMVPRILEKMMNGVVEKMSQASPAARLLAAAVRSGQQVFRARKANEPIPFSCSLTFRLTAAVRVKIKNRLFGKNFRHVVSGGAKLPVSVNEFFAAIGVVIYEGYGLTETCVATNVNRLGKNKIGSVGPCLEQVEIKIADDGEILFRGPNIAMGYYNRPTATRAAWDGQGWFHTGDLGELDGDGCLYITGRKKELIVTSGGKKISPLMIEDKLSATPLISAALVFGDGRQYCVALLVLDLAMLKQWASRNNVSVGAAFAAQPEILRQIQTEVDSVNATLSRYETIKKFRVLDTELTVENGLLTPTFKVKKALIERKYRTLIDEMYSPEPSAA